MTLENLKKVEKLSKRKFRFDVCFWLFAIATLVLNILSVSYESQMLANFALLACGLQLFFLFKLYKIRKQVAQLRIEIAVESAPENSSETSIINDENKSMYN